MEQLHLIATSPMGLEAVVARELKELGYADLQVENGRVNFRGGPEDICRTNLWLRTAGRILIQMGKFKAATFDELFEGTKALDWPDWIPENGEFPVEGRSHKSLLSSVPACQKIVKKAVVDKMKDRYGTEWFDENGGRYVIEVSLLNDEALLTLDTSGAGLHKRGYRLVSNEAPIRESMAAALILLSRWRAERPFYDPFCGSGTFLVEAAMIGWNIAPGLRRQFNSERWERIPAQLWDAAREEAYDSVKDEVPLQITGTDIDPRAIEISETSIKRAGFAKDIKVSVLPVSKAKPQGDYGVIITNPPYGERLGDEQEAEAALRQFGLMTLHYPTWSVFAISPSDQVEHYMGRPADKKRKLFNGRIQTDFYQFFGPLPPREKRHE